METVAGRLPFPLTGLDTDNGGEFTNYALAGWATERNIYFTRVSWVDDEWHHHWAWIPAGNVRRVTDSEWDIEEYRRCPEKLRWIRWGNRLPGFLPV
jgi:hypothetical protein